MISCLTVSDRPEWIPWCKHQVAKQDMGSFVDHVIIDGSLFKTIGEARTEALRQAKQPIVAWFDDDDWSHPDRLKRAAPWIASQGAIMCGNSSAWLVRADLKGYCAIHYPGYGQVIFNGGVFDQFKMPERFLECNNGEDFEWVKAGALLGASVLIPELQHAWLCHNKNIVNAADRLIFEHTLPGVIRITDDERRLIPV